MSSSHWETSIQIRVSLLVHLKERSPEPQETLLHLEKSQTLAGCHWSSFSYCCICRVLFEAGFAFLKSFGRMSKAGRRQVWLSLHLKSTDSGQARQGLEEASQVLSKDIGFSLQHFLQTYLQNKWVFRVLSKLMDESILCPKVQAPGDLCNFRSLSASRRWFLSEQAFSSESRLCKAVSSLSLWAWDFQWPWTQLWCLQHFWLTWLHLLSDGHSWRQALLAVTYRSWQSLLASLIGNGLVHCHSIDSLLLGWTSQAVLWRALRSTQGRCVSST